MNRQAEEDRLGGAAGWSITQDRTFHLSKPPVRLTCYKHRAGRSIRFVERDHGEYCEARVSNSQRAITAGIVRRHLCRGSDSSLGDRVRFDRSAALRGGAYSACDHKAADEHGHRPDTGGYHEGLRVGVPRHLEEPQPPVVRHGSVWQSRQSSSLSEQETR